MDALSSCLRSADMFAINKRTAFYNFILLWVIILGVSSLRLTITPNHQDAGVSGAVFRVICKASEPLTHCHFRWRDIYNNDGPLMDVSEGVATPLTANYSYSGTGLSQGECGISLNRPVGVQRWVVGCRVRTMTSGWHFAYMTLFAHLKGSTSLTLSPPSPVTVRPGGSVSLECKAANRLTGCLFRLPDGSKPANLTSNLESGICGVKLSEVTDSLNGFVWCRAWRDGYDEWRAFALTVASPPSEPVLEASEATYFQGDVLKLTCTVSRALPSANMTWYLGDEIIRQDHANDARNERWLWPFELRTIRQTLTRTLVVGDDGRVVTCGVKQVDDVELPGEVRSKYTISFYVALTEAHSFFTLVSQYLKEGDVLLAVCKVRDVNEPLAVLGTPQHWPQFTWFLGSTNLTSRSTSIEHNILTDKVTKTVVGEDDGKVLRCVIRHPSFAQPMERTLTIRVEHRPQLSSASLKEQFRFKVGSDGIAEVEFRANPKPDIYWTVDLETVEEGFTDSTGRFEASFLSNDDEAQINGSSRWTAQLFVNNVTLSDLQRPFFLNARNKLGGEFFRAVNFDTTEVAVVSSAPTLTVSPNATDYPVGSNITATCTVQRNRPVSAIKWTLSNRTVTEGVNRPVLSQTNRGVYTIVQSMTVQLKEADDGNQLACNVGSWRTSQNISVAYPPKKLAPVIEQSLQVGMPGELTVEISASPQPSVKWECRGITIQEGESDPSKQFRAAEVLPTARGKWAVKLIVSNVTQRDIGIVFLLTARNQAGSTTYHLLTARNQAVSTTYHLLTDNQPAEWSTDDDKTTTDDTTTSYQDLTTASEAMSTYSTHTNSNTHGQPSSQEFKYILHTSEFSYRYLAIANTITILVVVSLATFLYIRLLRRLSHTTQGFDMDRAPIYLDNIYYDQMNGTGGQCALNADQGTIGCS